MKCIRLGGRYGPLFVIFLLIFGLAGLASRNETFGMSEETKARLAQVLARSAAAHEREPGEDAPSSEEIREIESELILLLSQAPDNPTLIEALAKLYSRFSVLDAPNPALLGLISGHPEPARLALQLARDWEPDSIPVVGDQESELKTRILLAALAVDPSQGLLWERAARSTSSLAWKIAFWEEAFRRISSPDLSEAKVPVATVIAESWLEAQLRAGLAQRASATFQALPAAIRSAIEKGDAGQVGAEVDGLPFTGKSRDLRRSLATAHLLAGNMDQARASLAKARVTPIKPVSPRAEDGFSGRRTGAPTLGLQVLRHSIEPSPEDPFELFAEVFGQPFLDAHHGWHITDWISMARLAERESYPAIAAHALQHAVAVHARTAGSLSRGKLELAGKVPTPVSERAHQLEAEIANLSHVLERDLRTLRAAAGAEWGPDPAAAIVARRLAAPSPRVFEEHRLPPGIESLPDLPRPRLQAWIKEVGEKKWPSGFSTSRVERDGEKITAIAMYRGAYWLLLSADGGTTWSRPLYTGLRVNQPYVVRQLSALPLLAGDRLNIEVDIRELDTSAGRELERTETGLYLDIPIAALQRDSDADGLTDLAEERLFTDPESPDTDRDGLLDGGDPLPGVPRTADPGPAARALPYLLADAAGPRRGAIMGGIPAEAAGLEETELFIGDRAAFAGLHSKRRVVVLTEEEAEAAEKKLGPLFPIRLELFVFDRTGRKGLAIWSASGTGGQVRLEETGGTWKTQGGFSWIA